MRDDENVGGESPQRVAPWGRWQDLVIPQVSVDRLHDIIAHMHHRETVFVGWGLGQKVAVWRRVTALFAGPPGTGKTPSSSLVAQALGLDLFRIAFLRRIDILVDFPMPSREERRRLWRALVPASMPLAPDVDLDFLADRFELPGGLIMNALRSAATRCAAAGQPVGMVPLLRGVRDELHKQGKLVSKDDLGPFAKLLDGAPDAAGRAKP